MKSKCPHCKESLEEVTKEIHDLLDPEAQLLTDLKDMVLDEPDGFDLPLYVDDIDATISNLRRARNTIRKTLKQHGFM